MLPLREDKDSIFSLIRKSEKFSLSRLFRVVESTELKKHYDLNA
jgi:hypothetical protein